MATHRRGRPFNYGRPIPLHRLQEYNSWVELPDDPINDPPSSQNERRLSPDLVDDIAADFLPPPESQAQATPRRRPQRSGQPSSPSPSDPADVPHPATSFRPGRLRRVRGRMEDSDIGSISSPVLSDVESPEIPAMSGLGEQGVESRGRTEGTATNVASGTTGGQTEDIQRTLEAGTGSASAASGVHPATAGGTPDPTRPAADAPQQAAAQTEGGDSMAGPTPHATGSVGPVTTSTQLAPDIAHGVSATSREAIDVGGQAATAPGATDQTAPSARQGLGQAAGALTNTGQAIGTGAQAATTPGDTGGDEDEKEEDPFEIPFDYDEAYDQGLMDVLPPLELGTDYDDGRSQTKYRILLENNYVLFAWWLYRRTVEKHGGDKGEAIYQQPYDMVYHWICILYSMHPKVGIPSSLRERMSPAPPVASCPGIIH